MTSFYITHRDDLEQEIMPPICLMTLSQAQSIQDADLDFATNVYRVRSEYLHPQYFDTELQGDHILYHAPISVEGIVRHIDPCTGD